MASNGAIPTEEESENAEQQRTELEILQSIFTNKELTILKEDSEYLVEIMPKLNSDVQMLLLDFQNDLGKINSGDGGRSVQVTHLPPVTLYVKYPPDYPSRNPPIFHISSTWLDPKFSQQINERLLERFTQDLAVVYEWTLFLQDELVEAYSQQQIQARVSLEQTHSQKEMSKEGDGDGAIAESSKKKDPCQIFLRSSSLLNDIEEFDSYEKHREFQQSEHECGICCLSFMGYGVCRPCEMCGLLYCKDCLKGYCQMCIDEGKITQLICPEQGCSADLTDIFLKSALAEDLFERYIKLKDEANLDAVPGVVFCPRPQCASRNFSDLDSNLIQCDSCGFPFCKLCNQTWHGPGTCPSLEKLKNLDSVTSCDDESEVRTKSQALERKKMEELKSLLWLRSHDNVKACPTCQAMIQKNGGCNHMVCRRCNTHFCWLCGNKIHGYEHFDGGGCRLFRNEDYLPPEDKGPKEITVPKDLQVLETALVSVCPRCGESKTKSTPSNWIRCRHCRFQYCHQCREPCYGLWHFDEQYGCKKRTTVKEDLANAMPLVDQQHDTND